MKNLSSEVAVSKLYDFIWDIYCDWYIELTKPRIQEGGETKATAQSVLVWVMKGMLKLLHPFMPYITEEIWQVLTDQSSPIMISDYPFIMKNILINRKKMISQK